MANGNMFYMVRVFFGSFLTQLIEFGYIQEGLPGIN